VLPSAVHRRTRLSCSSLLVRSGVVVFGFLSVLASRLFFVFGNSLLGVLFLVVVFE